MLFAPPSRPKRLPVIAIPVSQFYYKDIDRRMHLLYCRDDSQCSCNIWREEWVRRQTIAEERRASQLFDNLTRATGSHAGQRGSTTSSYVSTNTFCVIYSSFRFISSFYHTYQLPELSELPPLQSSDSNQTLCSILVYCML